MLTLAGGGSWAGSNDTYDPGVRWRESALGQRGNERTNSVTRQRLENDLSFVFCRMSSAITKRWSAVVIKETDVVGNDPRVSRGV